MGTNLSVLSSNIYATKETGEPAHAGGSSGASVWWRWVAPITGTAVLDLTNGYYWSITAVYTGPDVSHLSVVASNQWHNSGNSSRLRFAAVKNQEYVLALDSYSGQGDVQFTLQLNSGEAVPEILRHPADATVTDRIGVVDFSVDARSVSPILYQWKYNGAPLPDQTNATLHLDGVRTNQAGPYTVVLRNAGGSVESNPAQLTVNARPINDDFVDRILLTQSVERISTTNTYATFEKAEPNHAGRSGYHSVWWSWTPAQSSQAILDLTGSDFGPAVGVYTGSSLGGLTLVTNNSNGTNKLIFQVQAGTTYQIAVDGSYGGQGQLKMLIAGIVAPSIVTQPRDQIVIPGEDARFSVVASSTTPLTYQWRFGTNVVANATNATLVVRGVTTNKTGGYSVLVSNDVGSTPSSSARLSTVSGLIGQVTDATDRHPLPGVVVSAGGVTNVTDSQGNYRLANVLPGGLRSDFEANTRIGSAPLTVHFLNRAQFGSLILNAVTNGYFPYANDQVPFSADQGVNLSFSMTPILAANAMRLVLNWAEEPKDLDAHLLTPAIAGTAYQIYYPPGSRGSLEAPPFSVLDYDYTNGFGPETITIGKPFTGTYHYYVYKFAGVGEIAGSSASVKIYTDQGLSRTITAPSAGNGRYWHVCDIDGETKNITIINQILSAAPGQPQSLFGEAPARQIGKSGALPPPPALTYLWDFGDGQTSTDQDPTNLYSVAGTYTVSLTVRAADGLVAKEIKPDFITVGALAPAITQQPQSVKVKAGDAATFTVAASGTPTLRYQWRFNGTNLSGAFVTTLALTNVQSAQTGGYSVVVTNNYGSATSQVATLSLVVSNRPPVVNIVNPTNGAVFTVGSNILLSAVASDPDGTVDEVDFFQGNLNLGEGLGQPYTLVWSNVTAGAYTLAAEAADDRGVRSKSSEVVIMVVKANQTITSPPLVNRIVGDNFLLTATASSGLPVTFTLVSGPATLTGANVTVTNVGVVTIKATQAGNASFNPAPEITRAFTVSGPTVTLDSLSITGPSSVNEGGTVNYTATAFLSDGSSQSITPRWTLDPSGGTISATGLLTANQVAVNLVVRLSASYTLAGITRTASKTITILNSTVLAPGYLWTTLAGKLGIAGYANGVGAAAQFNFPSKSTLADDGTLYVADTPNDIIRKVTPQGNVTLFAGAYATDGTANGLTNEARFTKPYDILADQSGNIYVADTFNSAIRLIRPDGMVTNFVGHPGVSGSNDGTGTNALFFKPYALTLDQAGTLYVADTGNSTIRKVSKNGVVTTWAGALGITGTNDGPHDVALFREPRGLAIDASGNVFVADQLNHTIRKITAEGVVSTFAGAPLEIGFADGQGNSARFNYPSGVALDNAGTLFVADRNNHVIRRITSSGLVATIGGTPGKGDRHDGVGSEAWFNTPEGILVDAAGVLYVTDTGNSAIRIGRSTTLTLPELQFSYADNLLVLSWPGSITGFLLEYADSSSGRNWTQASPSPVVINGQNRVTNNLSATIRFYRLRRP